MKNDLLIQKKAKAVTLRELIKPNRNNLTQFLSAQLYAEIQQVIFCSALIH
jgi:hypothetical protein